MSMLGADLPVASDEILPDWARACDAAMLDLSWPCCRRMLAVCRG